MPKLKETMRPEDKEEIEKYILAKKEATPSVKDKGKITIGKSTVGGKTFKQYRVTIPKDFAVALRLDQNANKYRVTFTLSNKGTSLHPKYQLSAELKIADEQQ